MGPPDGRYLLRELAGEEPSHVLVLSTLPAPVRRFPLGRRTRSAPAEPEPATAPLARLTLVDARPAGEDAAREWLARAAEDESVPATALAQVNTALRGYRAAAADPYVRDLAARHALVCRAGYGAGVEVAEGRWAKAVELKPSKDERVRRERREAALRPSERFAALLSARDAVLACEELVLRARLDLDQGRQREAALQAHLALEAAVTELQAFRAERVVAERLATLEEHRDAAAAAANEALRGGLSEAALKSTVGAVERVEGALRARSAAAPY